ncbi:CLUMA_CG005304, isoform A [Clunio marinus]|uniref:CLUMA_CG005304, isoform A n=1 Tax=Clunio marinus TaxID=568069 RepID=A0A1J1HYN8_9DIPT|nr:CLUMA_CG005304, isoform A [Clunio marinus]
MDRRSGSPIHEKNGSKTRSTFHFSRALFS